MIEDLRFVEREVFIKTVEFERAVYSTRKMKILQAYDGYVWFDVPLVTLEQND